MSKKILIADDHKILRDGLKSLIENETSFQVVAEAKDGEEAVELSLKHKPEIVIIDITMPKLNGIKAAEMILQKIKDVKIIALSVHADKRYVSQMFKVGAKGYLLKDCAFEELIQAIHTVIEDKVYISPAVAGEVVGDYIRHLDRGKSSVLSLLTQREREVLELLADGKNAKEVAFMLEISVKTIETHRRQLMEKLNIHSIAELTKYAIREGIINL
ncbi:MAG: response regulator transcription factor [Pseudomonadota bacterium]